MMKFMLKLVQKRTQETLTPKREHTDYLKAKANKPDGEVSLCLKVNALMFIVNFKFKLNLLVQGDYMMY